MGKIVALSNFRCWCFLLICIIIGQGQNYSQQVGTGVLWLLCLSVNISMTTSSHCVYHYYFYLLLFFSSFVFGFNVCCVDVHSCELGWVNVCFVEVVLFHIVFYSFPFGVVG